MDDVERHASVTRVDHGPTDEHLSWPELLRLASGALEHERFAEALQLCDRAAFTCDEARYYAAVLRGDTLLRMGDPVGALSSYDSVAHPRLPDAKLDCARGLALFELGRFPEAEHALSSAVRGDESLASAYFALGVMAEILGTGGEAELLRRARRLAPDRYPAPVQLSRTEFTDVVDEAVSTLEAGLANLAKGMQVVIAELPHPDDLREERLWLSPLAFGVLVPDAHPLCPDGPEEAATLQPLLVLYKRNLERVAQSRGALRELIAQTIAHEIEARM